MDNNQGVSNNDFENIAKNCKIDILKSGIFVHQNMIKGCSREEIKELELKNYIVLPNSYKIFLKNFGHGLGGYVMSDISVLYDEISGLTDYLKNEELIEEGDPRLPEKAFVMSTRNYEQFMFFDASGLVEEPPILYYEENAKSFVKSGDSVFDILQEEIRFAKYLKNSTEAIRKERDQRMREERKGMNEN